jgi:hypothetical protein
VTRKLQRGIGCDKNRREPLVVFEQVLQQETRKPVTRGGTRKTLGRGAGQPDQLEAWEWPGRLHEEDLEWGAGTHGLSLSRLSLSPGTQVPQVIYGIMLRPLAVPIFIKP